MRLLITNPTSRLRKQLDLAYEKHSPVRFMERNWFVYVRQMLSVGEGRHESFGLMPATEVAKHYTDNVKHVDPRPAG